MIDDDLDGYIVQHYRSMSQAEIARRFDTSEATVSRHVKQLKGDGRIAVDKAEGMKIATEAARASLKGSLSRGERIRALQDLRERLTDELDETGGSNLARVSSELRTVLEELETLTVEAVDAMVSVKKVEGDEVCKLIVAAVEEHGDEASTAEVVASVLGYLHDAGKIEAAPVDVLMGEAQYMNLDHAAAVEEADV